MAAKNSVVVAQPNPERGAFAISKARAQLILRAPFFAVLALKLEPKPNTRVETCATDGKIFWYNPAWAEATSIDELVGVMAQKALRISLGHPWRRGGRDKNLWQQAGDAVVNPLIRESFNLPEGAIEMPEFADHSAEEAYAILLKRQPPPSEGGQQPGQGAGQDDGQNPPGPGPGQGAGQEDGQGNGQGDGADDPNAPPPAGFNGDCGGCGEVVDATNPDGSALSKADRDAAEQDWKVAAAEAVQIAKSAGQLPGSLERLFAEAEKPRLDWKTMLRRYMMGKRHDDSTWRRPNRRFIGRGMYLPSRENPGPGQIVVAVDTSGSISGPELAAFSAELNAILDETKPKLVRVIYCDAMVQYVEEFTPEDYPVKLTARGGGGTSFSPVFRWIEEHADEPPEACVYLTDLEGYGDAFGAAPDFPVLWVTTARETAPYGEVVRLDLEKVEA